jgi:heat shock protein HslJ
MLESLRRTASWAVEASPATNEARLSLRDAQGQELLRFKPDELADLELGEWRLVASTVAGQRVMADALRPAVLTFRPSHRSPARRASSGEVLGSTGCNGIVASYVRAADVLGFDELERTDAPCTETLTVQEEAMIGVLESPSISLALPSDRLILSADDSGDRLELVSATPLQGSTWQLVSLAGAEIAAEPITMRLLDGTVRGAGPCGPYQAIYVTDGQFITFSDFAGTAVDGCPDEATERALLRALGSAVLVDRGRPGLRFRDARGEVLARFAPAGTV